MMLQMLYQLCYQLYLEKPNNKKRKKKEQQQQQLAVYVVR